MKHASLAKLLTGLTVVLVIFVAYLIASDPPGSVKREDAVSYANGELTVEYRERVEGPISRTSILPCDENTNFCKELVSSPIVNESPQACTQIYGGPESAKITGSVGGESVDYDFSRRDGCEMARWVELEKILDANKLSPLESEITPLN